MRFRGIVAWCLGSVLLATGAGAAEKDVEKIPFSQYCGMDRARFTSTRMLVEYGNKTTIGTCSIHCAAVDLAQSYGKEIAAILVADYRSGKLIDAAKAAWVIGARVPGVMAAKSRLAFASRRQDLPGHVTSPSRTIAKSVPRPRRATGSQSPANTQARHRRSLAMPLPCP